MPPKYTKKRILQIQSSQWCLGSAMTDWLAILIVGRKVCGQIWTERLDEAWLYYSVLCCSMQSAERWCTSIGNQSWKNGLLHLSRFFSLQASDNDQHCHKISFLTKQVSQRHYLMNHSSIQLWEPRSFSSYTGNWAVEIYYAIGGPNVLLAREPRWAQQCISRAWLSGPVTSVSHHCLAWQELNRAAKS